MKIIMLHFMSRTALLRAIGSMAVDGILVATCAGLYGLVFGGIGASIQSDPWQFITNAGYFALGGAIAGVLLGARNAVWNSDEITSERIDFAAEGTQEKASQVEAFRIQTMPSPRPSQTSLVVTSS